MQHCAHSFNPHDIPVKPLLPLHIRGGKCCVCHYTYFQEYYRIIIERVTGAKNITSNIRHVSLKTHEQILYVSVMIVI